MMTYRFGSLSYNEIYNFLIETDDVFLTPLSQKVNIEEYARKLESFSLFSYCTLDNSIVGLISCYMNHPPEAYISNVCVLPRYQNRGIFRTMLKYLTKELRQASFTSVRLEVADDNAIAQTVYKKCGFYSIGPASAKSHFYVLSLSK